ncbi:HTH-type transcriptional repressor KstR2 [Pleomorphomonas sp. T1.2MG-36]|uniref:TetR/AcrR family transcriptional regulator n=1 Tax=Pleomorphomonas sp. T1.2MG-36 TaxID=3041167 RepID=UPI002477C0F5|nr:TetR/AcrR family transcriptional regulator [Pleomorphomonas sp. T1.2MG-36]CAI9403816.1 HTH-type transcriptional repressor KstR2 [Pleomorphomonas sp. T1.2MG-36]
MMDNDEMVSGCVKRPRERIIDTAQLLFRKHGIRGVGVDAIAEEAGTNKMTLYRHFGSKDELIAECLRETARTAAPFWRDLETNHPGDPLAQLHAWVRAVASYASMEAGGCDLVTAAFELPEPDHPARLVVETFKHDQREKLVGLCREAGIAEAEKLADTLSLLLEGARVNRRSVGPDGPSARFVMLAEAVIASFSAASGKVGA